MFRAGRILCESSKPGSSVGRKIFRGIAVGGLAGGVIGLGVELAPDDSWVKRTADDWIAKGHEYLKNPVEGATPVQPTHREEATHVQPTHEDVEQPQGESVRSPGEEVHAIENEVREEGKIEIKEGESQIEEKEVLKGHVSPGEVALEENAHSKTEIPEVVAEKLEEAGHEESKVPEVFEDKNIQTDVEDVDIAKFEKEKVDGDIREITRLRKELALLRAQYDSDMAQAAGVAEASLSTMDRLYSERETAISTARHGLMVNELLVEMVRDRAASSGGSLRVAFQEALPAIVKDCFVLPEEQPTSFMKVVMGKLLGFLYSPSAGLPLAVSGRLSPTFSRLYLVQNAQAAVERGDFLEAVSLLERLRSETAREWTLRARVAMQLWQGAEAAVASMHEDLAKVLL